MLFATNYTNGHECFLFLAEGLFLNIVPHRGGTQLYVLFFFQP